MLIVSVANKRDLQHHSESNMVVNFIVSIMLNYKIFDSDSAVKAACKTSIVEPMLVGNMVYMLHMRG